eukprot:1161048-Pelagomonas_calceolata.AAC.8
MLVVVLPFDDPPGLVSALKPAARTGHTQHQLKSALVAAGIDAQRTSKIKTSRYAERKRDQGCQTRQAQSRSRLPDTQNASKIEAASGTSSMHFKT